MLYFLCGLCVTLMLVICALLFKIALLHKAADEIRLEFAARLETDTNVGLHITSADPKMRRLASDIDGQLKLLRKEHIRYEQGDRELKDAITNIAHDLRTPLTAICGYMELLDREETSEPVRRYLQIIANRIDALKALMDELFQYSVIVSAYPMESQEMININQAIEECVLGYYGALKDRDIVPKVTIPEARVERQLDKVALSRILANILNNVVKYSDGDLQIVLSAQGVITFSNHAEQLDEVRVGRLFDRFYTVHNGANGTGLGLSIAKLLTERIGGSISASKEGSVFTITLRLPAK